MDWPFIRDWIQGDRRRPPAWIARQIEQAGFQMVPHDERLDEDLGVRWRPIRSAHRPRTPWEGSVLVSSDGGKRWPRRFSKQAQEGSDGS